MRRRGSPPLPLLLVSAMVVIGAGIEIVSGGARSWAPELPLVALLALALLRDARSRRVAPPHGS